MSEQLIPRVEKSDIKPPVLEAGGTAIVLQRHEKYNRDPNADDAGSIGSSEAADAQIRDREFFDAVLGQEDTDNSETMFLIVSSDTQYAGKGRRSMETAQLALDAASEALEERGVDPSSRILNLSESFSVKGFEGRDIRPVKGIVEPKIFDDTPKFVEELGRMFNPPELQEEIDARRTDVKLSQPAFAAYEADTPEVQELREKHGAEGVHDIVDRTKHSLAVLERYSRWFHKENPGKKLVVWAASHYDTISPLVKDATGTDFDAFTPVDYGAGVVMTVEPESHEMDLHAQGKSVPLNIGKSAVEKAIDTE